MTHELPAAPSASAARRWLAGGALLLVISFVALLAFGLQNRNAAQPAEGTLAPDFTLPLFSGYAAGLGPEVPLAALRGKVVVVNFWASWCVTCRDEQVFMEQTWQKYKERGVIFLGVDYVDTEPAAREYLQQFGVTYPNGPDLKTKISTQYRILGVPETFVINKNGVIVLFHPAPFSDPAAQAKLIQVLDRALSE